jgi:septal ring factor EnvC (AmiA/AmiB activator)
VAAACAAAADELAETRRLVGSLESANAALRERLETERRISSLLENAKQARESEAAALRTALAAKDETIAAKDAIIDVRRQQIETLKKRTRSPLARVADILIGAAVFAILK